MKGYVEVEDKSLNEIIEYHTQKVTMYSILSRDMRFKEKCDFHKGQLEYFLAIRDRNKINRLEIFCKLVDKQVTPIESISKLISILYGPRRPAHAYRVIKYTAIRNSTNHYSSPCIRLSLQENKRRCMVHIYATNKKEVVVVNKSQMEIAIPSEIYRKIPTIRNTVLAA